MADLLMPVYLHLPLYNLVVGSSGMVVVSQYGPFPDWSI